MTGGKTLNVDFGAITQDNVEQVNIINDAFCCGKINDT